MMVTGRARMRSQRIRSGLSGSDRAIAELPPNAAVEAER